MASSRDSVVEVKRPKKRVTFGLIVLAILMPWLALYLDGSSWPTIAINFAGWLFLFPIGSVCAIVHAIICLCRTDNHRKYSRPARRSLRYDNKYSADTKPQTEKKAVEPAPEPEPAPVTRAAIKDEPKPVERAPTEPPTKNASATTSSTSVSSSDVEKVAEPAPAPPQRIATAPPLRTATAPPSRAATTKKDDDPFKDPNA
ncbi:hypothetical protein E8E11_002529 [Didymella keratinophila]|nr:hypothetical protein E8E11_002529 [Didymella keratinophila]